MEQRWKKTINEIRTLFKDYSAEDVAGSLFVLSLWLPNLAGIVKSLYLTSIFANLNESDFVKINKINNYNDFNIFCDRLLKTIPDFPLLEDYVPELDWGDIRYFFGKKNYKIFYGGSISHIYDFLSAYELLYCSQDNIFEERTKRSPSSDLERCLAAQNWIIERIDTQKVILEDNSIESGNFEKPTQSFWKNSIDCFNDVDHLINLLKDVKEFTIRQGELESELLEYDNFSNHVMEGNLLLGYFIKNDDKLFPILPRRFSEVLIEKWSVFFEKSKLLDKDLESIQKKTALSMTNFLEDRFYKKDFVPIVCAVKENGYPGELTYSGYFLGKEKLTLVYVAKPYISKVQIEKIISGLEKKLRTDLSFLLKEPITLGLPRLRKNVQFKSKVTDKKLNIEILLVLAQATTKMIPVRFPKIPSVRIVFLDQFLGVMDEIENAAELSDYLHYLSSIESQVKIPITTFLDKFASFRHSRGVLVYGANEPNLIMLDLQSGSNYRFKNLSIFWSIFPDYTTLLGHPRSWKITDASEYVRLTSRNEFSIILYVHINNMEIFITSPFQKITYEQGAVSDMLMQLLQDYFVRFGNFFSNHKLAQKYDALHIVIFPDGVLEDFDFKHIAHLNPSNNNWRMDIGVLQEELVGMRVVFSEKKVMKKFHDVRTNEMEHKFFSDALDQINSFIDDGKTLKVISEALAKERSKPPRFTIIKEQKSVSFPEFINPQIPTDHEHKLSRKRIAQLALKAGINPGSYNLKEAHKILSKLRVIVIKEINSEVKKHPYKKSILKLISISDALVHDFERKRLSLQNSVNHDVDYSRKKIYASAHSDFVHNHKNNRYLIEKFVQLKPTGRITLDPDRLKYLIALIDKLLEIAAASDNLHYGIFQVGLNISRDFVVTVKYKKDLESMDHLYGEYEAGISLGLLGNESDRVNSEYPIEELLNNLDQNFLVDFGFSLKDLVNILQVLSQWPLCKENEKESTTYNATATEIDRVSNTIIKGFKSNTKKILDFLTLNNKNLLEITGSIEADDIPIWEHNKRPFRYTLRPLMCFNRRYFWGPYSANKVGKIWINITSSGTLPFIVNAPNVNKTLLDNQRLVQARLEKKALEITKKFTPFAERVNYSRRTHPQNIGEFDVLAYLESENIILNIECKDIVGAYCLKDAKTTRDTIFRLDKEKNEDGEMRKVKNPGNLLMVEKRETYLQKEYKKFAQILKWPIKDNPRIISLYVTRQNYWWTFHPPRKTNITFMRVDFLNDYIKSLVEKE